MPVVADIDGRGSQEPPGVVKARRMTMNANERLLCQVLGRSGGAGQQSSKPNSLGVLSQVERVEVQHGPRAVCNTRRGSRCLIVRVHILVVTPQLRLRFLAMMPRGTPGGFVRCMAGGGFGSALLCGVLWAGVVTRTVLRRGHEHRRLVQVRERSRQSWRVSIGRRLVRSWSAVGRWWLVAEFGQRQPVVARWRLVR